MNVDEKNRYVLERIRRELEENDGFYGKIVLNCADGRIASHEVRQVYGTDEILEDVEASD